MAFLQLMRSPRLSFIQTVVSLLLGGGAIMSSYWCVGKQKVPKPLCSPTKHSNCIPVPGVSNSSSIQFSWETGDDRFVFPTFHTGLFFTCEENIYTDAWEEKCRGFYTLTPGAEKAMMWLSLSLELMYIGLLLISCTLLSVQLCIRAWFPSTQRWGQLLNAFAAVFTVLGGLLGMVGHMMFMQVFQMTVSMGPEDFKPHSYGYSWAFYVAWVAFTVCMSAGVSTLNNYTKKVLMVGPRRNSGLNTCSFNFLGLMPPAPYYTPANPAVTLACPPSPPRISHLSPYYEPPSAKLAASTPRLTHSHSLPLPHSDSFPPPPSHPAPSSPFHRHSLPSPSPLPSGHQNHYQPEEDYSPL
ncbi:germ cell-specific gene 1-like protein isoform X2 [Larimichthys crocea]|uniref:germ cell-specific gene 1-like protein isoform X2 n=1 Tax=Larimichthys crocea TaxID=215358 RepID=UPI000F6042F0|nr:germ cell-specific gene 1-like protein isoform X2 [Larimichthys crocea]